MTRSILFQLHWFLGITAGLVLAVMGMSGALISFEDELLAAINPGVITIEPATIPPLSAPALAKLAEVRHPGMRMTRIIVHDDPSRSAWVSFKKDGSKERTTNYVDPASGRLLGSGRGQEFFDFTIRFHRWLALPDGGDGLGRHITGVSAIALIFFALSGLYLRWPRRPLDWRAWLTLDWRKTGRNFHRALHATIGGWAAIFYLISAGTGLCWSYAWYRDGVNHLLSAEAVDTGMKGTSKSSGNPANFAVAWTAFLKATGGRPYETVTATLRDNGEVQIRAKLPGARHDRVSDELTIDGTSGTILSRLDYADRALGENLVISLFEIHRGAYFGMAGRIGITTAALMTPLFTVTGWLLYLARRRRKRALKAVPRSTATSVVASDRASTLVVFASQTGTAERIARLTAEALPSAAILPIAQLNDAALARTDQLLLIASSYGEGEPPDTARGVARRMMTAPRDLAHIRYAVLALGDREYDDYCAFGHRLDHWLHESGAARMFDLVEMDGDDAGAQRSWQQQLAALGARTDQPDWARVPMADWRLVERRLLNPGSMGGPAYHIALEPLAGASADWLPGDILEVEPRHDPRRIDAFLAASGCVVTPAIRELLARSILPGADAPSFDAEQLKPLAHREYSIASIARSGRIDLIVRQREAADGLPGLGSGWLTEVAGLGATIKARIRSNPAFHPPSDPARTLILIGNGTGLAGLLAHLRHRAASGGAPSWLFWGERHPDFDDFHGEELRDLQRVGHLEQLICAWSRQVDGRYVQDEIIRAADKLRVLIDAGAAIFVCGSLQGMAPAVDASLREILGDAAVEQLIEEGRYSRDIY